MVLKETGEKIYESGLVPPGDAITKVVFDRKIAKGIHPVLVKISTYSLKDYKQEMNGGQIETNIVGIEKKISRYNID